jgi:hypothetical protein
MVLRRPENVEMANEFNAIERGTPNGGWHPWSGILQGRNL